MSNANERATGGGRMPANRTAWRRKWRN